MFQHALKFIEKIAFNIHHLLLYSLLYRRLNITPGFPQHIFGHSALQWSFHERLAELLTRIQHLLLYDKTLFQYSVTIIESLSLVSCHTMYDVCKRLQVISVWSRSQSRCSGPEAENWFLVLISLEQLPDDPCLPGRKIVAGGQTRLCSNGFTLNVATNLNLILASTHDT